ncbi:methyltransferase domain-containing protein [Kineococcus sp. SYSU DK004]|uniref:methyltransferase domain-containing protein n=1 Tax=Kineococcus sp. SYSU DK004 TaxID=3383125 RepID=UPI003D7D3F8C
MGRFENVASLADPAAGAVAVDLACGSGRTTRALLAAGAGTVHAVDVGSVLDDDLLLDPRVRAHISSLTALPLEDGTADVAASVNAVEHLDDVDAHLRELHRVLRPGGRAVLAHSDWDTALFTSEDDQLTRRLLDRFVAAAPAAGAEVDGFAGRKLLRHAARSPFTVESVHSWADPHRRFDEGSVAWKVATAVLAAAGDEEDLAPVAAGWVEGLRRTARAGQFLFTVTDVALVLRRD